MSSLKSSLRTALPQSAIERLRYLVLTLPRLPQAAWTRRIFEAAPRVPAYLGMQDLARLQAACAPAADYGYSPETVAQRGIERCQQLLRLTGAPSARRFLELGCWDGMVSAALAARGKDATAVDARTEGFDERARRVGVRLLKCDAAAMDFADDSFDFVFSYDAFEHFAAPGRVLAEALRVVKPGGHIYLEFGPLYYSAYGEHAYRSIRVPYCQFLFAEATLNEFADSAGLPRIDFAHVNRLSLQDYRNLWAGCADVAARIQYTETANLAHLGLLRQYPSCFKSKSDQFESFTISGISVLLQKKLRAS